MVQIHAQRDVKKVIAAARAKPLSKCVVFQFSPKSGYAYPPIPDYMSRINDVEKRPVTATLRQENVTLF